MSLSPLPTGCELLPLPSRFQEVVPVPRTKKSGLAAIRARSPCPSRTHDWRTRKDPFEREWSEVLTWLEKDPDTTAKSLFERLQCERPGVFEDGQLRTLQRRVREWRHIMAKKLVYGTEAK